MEEVIEKNNSWLREESNKYWLNIRNSYRHGLIQGGKKFHLCLFWFHCNVVFIFSFVALWRLIRVDESSGRLSRKSIPGWFAPWSMISPLLIFSWGSAIDNALHFRSLRTFVCSLVYACTAHKDAWIDLHLS